MTFAILHALHALIGTAINDIERVYAQSTPSTPSSPSPIPSPSPSTPSSPVAQEAANQISQNLNQFGQGCYVSSYVSPPPSPIVLTMRHKKYPSTPPSSRRPSTPTTPLFNHERLDFPALDAPYDQTSMSEALTSHPVVVNAIGRIVAAAGQMSATVQPPFLSLCDAGMGYHLPACLRLLEASHTVEILREVGAQGMHVAELASRNGTDEGKLAHILRLLATHHILREVTPDVFALNRISGLMDTGKASEEIFASPETKYENSNGISAFVGLCTDELFKSSAYLTEAYLHSSNAKYSRDPTKAPFNFAFGTRAGFFGWLEGENVDFVNGFNDETKKVDGDARGKAGKGEGESHKGLLGKMRGEEICPGNAYRLERFGKAMLGTGSWEAPGAVLGCIDWSSLPPGSTIIDVGGGIGSTTMVLAEADEGWGRGLKFIVQDREVVVGMGVKAWNAARPSLVNSGIVKFQVHDFFMPQPTQDTLVSVFLLRAILHDWPDEFARRILLRLREAACVNGEGSGETKLIIADYVLPLACVDDFGKVGDKAGAGIVGLEGVEGAEQMLAPAPLLANLGKASANAYWMDLTMQVTFNAQERTLREIVELASSAGWRIVRVSKGVGSLFGYVVAVPGPIPASTAVAPAPVSNVTSDPNLTSTGVPTDTSGLEGVKAGTVKQLREGMERMGLGLSGGLGEMGSRCGTPTFGSRMDLRGAGRNARSGFGGQGMTGFDGRRGFGRVICGSQSRVGPNSSASGVTSTASGALKQATEITPGMPSTVIGGSSMAQNANTKKRPVPLKLRPSPSMGRLSDAANGARSPPLVPRTGSSSGLRVTPLSPGFRKSPSSSSSPLPRQSPKSPTKSPTFLQMQLSPSVPRYPPASPVSSRLPTPSTPRQPPPPTPILARQPLPTSPIIPRNPPPSPMSPRLPRRLSHAPPPSLTLRRRTESTIGNGGLNWNVHVGIGGGVGMGSLLEAFGGDVDGRNCGEGGEQASGVSVLAAAARIERGLERDCDDE